MNNSSEFFYNFFTRTSQVANVVVVVVVVSEWMQETLLSLNHFATMWILWFVWMFTLSHFFVI